MFYEGGFERREGQLVDPQGPHQRMPPDAVEQRPAPDNDSCLGPAQELVSAERADADAGVDAGADGRLVADRVLGRPPGQESAAEILHQRDLEPRAQLRQLRKCRPFGEALDAEIGRVDPEDQRCPFADGRRVVCRPRPVRRSHFAQDRAGLPHHIRDPEAAANFHELAARDDHFAAIGERGQHEEHRRGVVVHDGRRLGAGQLAQQPGRMDGAGPALPRHDVVFQVGVTARHLRDAIQRRPGQRRAPQVGMDDDPGRVDDGPERRRERGAQARFEARQNDGGGGLGVGR